MTLKRKISIEFLLDFLYRCRHFAFDLDAVSGRVAHRCRRRQRGAFADGGEVEQDL